MNKITKIAPILTKKTEIYGKEINNFMNQSKVVEYLFNKPIKKYLKMLELLEVDYDYPVKQVILDPKDVGRIRESLFVMTSLALGYAVYNEMYRKYLKKNNLKIKQMPLPSKRTKQIIDILEELEGKYNLEYTFKWSFKCEGEHLHLGSNVPINFTLDFVYDFFGVSVYGDKLVMFVIEFDKEENELEIIKQYILFQMNVHLLRLNKNDPKKQIKNFIKKIIKTDKYVIINPLTTDSYDDSVNEDLQIFFDEYRQNHVAYLKNPKRKSIAIKERKEDCDDEPEEDEVVVDNKLFQKIMDKKMILTNSSQLDSKSVARYWKEKNETIFIPEEIQYKLR